MKFAPRLFVGFVLAASLPLISVAQQAQPPDATSSSQTQSNPTASGQQNNPATKVQGAPTTPATQSDKPDKKDGAQSTSSQGKAAGTSNDRLFLALPNFLTLENSGKVPPLTATQKFKVVARGSFDKIEFPWYGVISGISQAENSEPGYGQGWEGYAKRYGSAFADGTIENFMVGAVFPSLLHQDPRFYQTSQGTFAHRAGYAVSRIFVTRTDSGRSQFNYSEIFGSALSAAISTNTYHPRAFISTRYDPTTNMLVYVHNASDRTLPNTLSVWGTQIAYDTITIVIKEFWPDVHRKMVKKHDGSDAPQGNNTKP
ncbi:MAG: hypothetical protein WAM78_00815 [Candidatus Sulfotelmatobacter sp.]